MVNLYLFFLLVFLNARSGFVISGGSNLRQTSVSVETREQDKPSLVPGIYNHNPSVSSLLIKRSACDLHLGLIRPVLFRLEVMLVCYCSPEQRDVLGICLELLM